MLGWKTTYTRPKDGKRIQKKKCGKAVATVFEGGYNAQGWSHWSVYVGNGDNTFAAGASRTFLGSKIAASRALKAACK